jgi:SET domain-containing protein
MKTYLPQTWRDPRLEIDRSSLTGEGMITLEPIREGEVVCIIGGTVMTEAEFADFQATPSLYSYIQVEEDLYLVEDVEASGTLYAAMNHSCDPNSWMADEVTLVARRDIEAGEEVTVDYAMFTTQSNWIMDSRCRCGSPYCRRIITGDDWMLEDLQERYRGHFSPFINRKIEESQKGDIHGSESV